MSGSKQLIIKTVCIEEDPAWREDFPRPWHSVWGRNGGWGGSTWWIPTPQICRKPQLKTVFPMETITCSSYAQTVESIMVFMWATNPSLGHHDCVLDLLDSVGDIRVSWGSFPKPIHLFVPSIILFPLPEMPQSPLHPNPSPLSIEMLPVLDFSTWTRTVCLLVWLPWCIIPWNSGTVTGTAVGIRSALNNLLIQRLNKWRNEWEQNGSSTSLVNRFYCWPLRTSTYLRNVLSNTY